MKKSPQPDRNAQPSIFDLEPFQMTTAGLPPTVRRVIETSNDIVQDSPEQTDFLHAILCQVGMPRSATRDRHFERANGSAMMRLEAGAMYDGKRFVEQPLPYGAKPRLMMVHIGSQAVRTRVPEIEIGHSTREFMQELGLDTNGQSYTGIKKQINALAHCRMSLGWKTGNRVNTLHTQPIERFEAWLHPTGHRPSCGRVCSHSAHLSSRPCSNTPCRSIIGRFPRLSIPLWLSTCIAGSRTGSTASTGAGPPC